MFLGLSAQAQISATFSPVVQEIEFCATSGTTSQNFTVTGSTSCSVNPNALSYQWFIDDGGTITNLSASGGSGYNSGTAATLTVTSLQSMSTSLFSGSCNVLLYCKVSETASGCIDIDTVGGWEFIPVQVFVEHVCVHG